MKHLNLVIQVLFKATFIILGGENIQVGNLQVAKTNIVYVTKPLSAKIYEVRNCTGGEVAIRKTSIKLLNISVV